MGLVIAIVGAPGSSPLTRGKPYCLLLVRVRVGLIPAHAGKTRVMVAWSVMRAAHPRSRGENDEKWAASDAMQGSSPLTRGKCRQLLGRASIPGLIPAHAGKTTSALTCVSAPRAHPRSRGENGEQDPQCLRRAGSSPLTRGKRRLRQRRPERRRLIPAHAGKTRSRKLEQLSARAHTRSRGENVVRVVEMPVRCSSSPLTRGKLVAHSPVLQARRLIPAHAGKTVAQVVRLKVFRAHPRSRGENRCAGRDVIAPCGSSPLTRGKREADSSRARGQRLIPAHAGKTTTARHPIAGIVAHPRSRGENDARVHEAVDDGGSSPLTRGKLQAWHRSTPRPGLIPAHAGKTRGCRGRVSGDGAHPRSRGENAQ